MGTKDCVLAQASLHSNCDYNWHAHFAERTELGHGPHVGVVEAHGVRTMLQVGRGS